MFPTEVAVIAAVMFSILPITGLMTPPKTLQRLTTIVCDEVVIVLVLGIRTMADVII